MPPETIFLLCKAGISLVIGLAAILSIVLGFKLLMKRRAGAPEESTIKLLGFSAKVNSLGALMMVAGIALALISASFFPKGIERKSDGSVTIAVLEGELKKSRESIDNLESSARSSEEKLLALEEDKSSTALQLQVKSQELAKANVEMEEARRKFGEIAAVMENMEKAMKDDLASVDSQHLMQKYEELQGKCVEYEAMIADLTQRLKDAEQKKGKASQK